MWFVELYRAGWVTSALAQLHKWAFYWTNPSNSPGLGTLPRKHSLDRISPYTGWKGPVLSLPSASLLLLVLLTAPWFVRVFLVPSCLFSAVLLFFAWSATPCTPSNVVISGLWSVTSSHAIGCVLLKSVVTVSYYVVYLPERGSSRIQIFSIWSHHKSTYSFFRPIRRAVYNV